MVERRSGVRRAALAVVALGTVALPFAAGADEARDTRADQHQQRPHRNDDQRAAPNIYYTAPPIVYQPPAYDQQPKPFPTLTTPLIFKRRPTCA